MKRGLGRLFGRGRSAVPATGATGRLLALDTMPAGVWAIGDVHGCRGLLAQIQRDIVADAAHREITGTKLIVLLGDVIDRGPDSAGVLSDLIAPPPAGFTRVVLRGNHEAKMLDFLADPEAHREWLYYGGDATLLSYGLKPEKGEGAAGFAAMSASRLRAMITTGIPEAHRQFLSGLPVGLSLPGHALVHAGMDPSQPLQVQPAYELLWGDPARADGVAGGPLVVHGHVVHETPQRLPERINVDTGAWKTGHLSAVRLQPGAEPEFLGVRGYPG